jgi:class 3 adenylate cyclase/tetratricopeptide (TPR) repeat protein
VRAFLIADIRGYTRFTSEHGDEAAARLAARFAAICREVAGARGGEVLELRGDEALAIFSSTRAALLAAADLQSRAAAEAAADPSLPLQVGIGLDAGEAVAVEGGFRGTALNLASRLCSLAGPGEVLASETMTALARRLEGIEYRERGMMPLKGFEEPVRVMEVVSAPSGGTSTPARLPPGEDMPIGSYLGALPEGLLIGRDAELERAVAVIDTVLAGDGRTILLAGEPGAGKTRLAQEITVVLRKRGFALAAGRCYEPLQAVPFYPVIDALTALYARVSGAVRAAVPELWPDLARLLPGLGIAVPEHAGPEDQQRLFWAVSAFLHAAAGDRPVALLFDDLHWADAATLDLLQHLVRHIGSDRILILATFRDVEVHRRHPLEWVLRDLQREGLVERIDVRRLNEASTHDLIAGLMGEETISAELAGLIHRRTDGNPFFVQQVLRVLVERGDIYRKDGRWDRRSIEEIEVPESIRSVVGQRLSRLAEATQEMLREASVLGETFTFEDLQSLTDRSEADLEAALDESIDAGIVRDRGREGYAFDHALTCGSLDAELSSRRRRRLHLAAGEALEALPERKRMARSAELAWHFLEGDDPERGLRWSLAAGDAAEAVFAHSDAEGQYRTALQLAEEEGWEDQAQISREKLARTLFLLSRLEEALEVLEAALHRYRDAGDAEGEMRVLGEMSVIFFDRGRRDDGLALVEPVLARWKQDPIPSPGACSLLIGVAELYWHAGRMDDALAAIGQAVDLAGAIRDDRLLGHAENRLGVLLAHTGRSAEALAAYDRAISASERAGDLGRIASTLNNRALANAEAGRMAEAGVDLDRALTVARQVGTPDQIGWQLVLRAQMRFAVEGDWARARAMLDEVAPLEPYMKGTRSSFHVTMVRWTRLIAEDDPAMVAELERLVEEGERSGDLLLWAGAQTWLANWEVLEGRTAEAIARCRAVHANQDVEEQFRRGVDSPLARAYIDSGKFAAAGTLIQRGLARLGSGSPYQQVEWLGLLVRLRSAEGRWDDAESELAQIQTLVRDGRIVLAQAEALLLHGDLLAQRGDSAGARTRYEEAGAIFARMHALYHLHCTERVLAALPVNR